MIQPNSITAESIKNPQIIIEIIKTAQTALADLNYSLAYQLYSRIKKADGLQIKSLQSSITALKAYSLPFLALEEIKNLFSQNIKEFLRISDFNAVDRLREKMLATQINEEAVLKQELVQILQSNQNILIESKNQKSAVADAARKINKKTTLDEFKKSIQWPDLNFINQGIAIKFYELYYYLLLDPNSIEGFDEKLTIVDPKTGKLYQYNLGKLIDLKTDEQIDLSEEPRAQEVTEFTVNFADLIKRKDALQQRLSDLKDADDYQELITKFRQAIQDKNQILALSALYQLSLFGRSESLLKELGLTEDILGLQMLVEEHLIDKLKMDLTVILLIMTDISSIALKTGHYKLSYPYFADNEAITDMSLDKQNQLNVLYLMLKYDVKNKIEIDGFLNYLPEAQKIKDIENVIQSLKQDQPSEAVKKWKQYEVSVKDFRILLFYSDIAKRLYRDLSHFIEDNQTFLAQDSQNLQETQKYLYVLEWIILPFLSDEQIDELVERRFVEVLDYDLDIINQLELKLLLFTVQQRDGLRSKLRRSLLRNKQILTQARVVLDTRERKGSIANWLLDYNNKLGSNEPAGSLDFSKYVTNSQNTLDLQPRDRERLIYLLHFYEVLKTNSVFARGLIESIPFQDKNSLKLLVNGNIEDVDFNKELRKILQESNKTERQELDSPKALQSVIQERQSSDKIHSTSPTGSSTPPNPILSAFNALPIPLAQIQAKMADLQARLSAQPKILEQILENPERVKDDAFVVAALLLSIKYQVLSIKDKKGLQVFIRDLLEKKLGWSAEHSAKIGIRVANILGVGDWAYYDKSEERFRWV